MAPGPGAATLFTGPDPTRLAPDEQARLQLFTLFRGGLDVGEWYELRTLDCSRRPARPGPRLYFRSLTRLIAEALRLRDGWDVFFGVGLRRCPAAFDIHECPHSERGADHISRLPAAWGDFDVADPDTPTKPYASVDDLLVTLRGVEPRPALLVASGHGVHAYWSLPEPTSDLARVERINRGIRARLQSDNAVDAARILRLAGTFNRKHGNPLPVQLLEVLR